MAIAITPYTGDWIPAVQAFNSRLRAAGVASEFCFPESEIPAWLPRIDGRRIYQLFHLAVEGHEVRGGYILKFQDFWVGGEARHLAYFHLPISEGVCNKAYSSVGVVMLRHAVRAQPLLFCLGMGSADRPLPRMLRAVGWSLHSVPFYFKVNRAARFLREIAVMRRTAARRVIADVAASTGVGRAALAIAQWRPTVRADRSVRMNVVDSFGEWADDLWCANRSSYGLVGSRDRATLNVLYPPGSKFVRLAFARGSRYVGWAVVLDSRMSASKYFGDLRVGSIVDTFGALDDAQAVAAGAVRFLQGLNVDLLVSNQAHPAWTAALGSAGCLPGPSNFLFGASKALHDLAPFDSVAARPHLTRGDGDGPINL